jgi:hypothetical protein
METALGEAEIAVVLQNEGVNFGMSLAYMPTPSDEAGEAKFQLHLALERATRLQSHELIDRLTTSLALIAELDGADGERDEAAALWEKQQIGDTERLMSEREEIKQFGRMVRMVGLRVAEAWR